MYSNEQVSDYVIDLMKQMEIHINVAESEIKEEEPDVKTIGLHIGKISQIYALVCEFTGVFSGIDWRVGGFKESARFSREHKEISDVEMEDENQ